MKKIQNNKRIKQKLEESIQTSEKLAITMTDQIAPLIPEVFAPGIVSDSTWAEHCQVAVSPNGKEIYWSSWFFDKNPEKRKKCI